MHDFAKANLLPGVFDIPLEWVEEIGEIGAAPYGWGL